MEFLGSYGATLCAPVEFLDVLERPLVAAIGLRVEIHVPVKAPTTDAAKTTLWLLSAAISMPEINKPHVSRTTAGIAMPCFVFAIIDLGRKTIQGALFGNCLIVAAGGNVWDGYLSAICNLLARRYSILDLAVGLFVTLVFGLIVDVLINLLVIVFIDLLVGLAVDLLIQSVIDLHVVLPIAILTSRFTRLLV